MWSVGDQIGIPWNGTIGILDVNSTVYVKIMGLDYNKSVMTGGRSNVLFKGPYSATGTQLALVDSLRGKEIANDGAGFCMNRANTYPTAYASSNQYGWEGSYPNKILMSQAYVLFPVVWQNVLATCTIYTDNVGNKSGSVASNVTPTQNVVFYPAAREVFDTVNAAYANTYEGDYQQLFPAYANGMSRAHYKFQNKDETTSVWLRSPVSSITTGFNLISSNDKITSFNAAYSQGVVLCFVVAA